MYKNPKVGVGILIFNEKNQLLVIQRNNKKGEGKGSWSPPGGYVDWGEHFLNAAKREALEETGLKIKNIELFSVTSEMLPSYHSITIWVKSYSNGTKISVDKDEVGDYKWCEINNPPTPLFEPFKQLIQTKEWRTKVR